MGNVNKGRIILAMNNDWRLFCMMEEEVNTVDNKETKDTKKPSNYEHYWKDNTDRMGRPLKEE